MPMIDLNRASQYDPVNREAYKQTEVPEMSPMDPPEAYSPPASIAEIPYEQLPQLLKDLMDEHQECLKKLDVFEKLLLELQSSSTKIDQGFFGRLSDFFRFFDEEIAPHNRKEEKTFFTLLNKRLIESGEHSKGNDESKTAISILEADHSQFIQLAGLAFNLFGLATRLPDPRSQLIVLDVAIEQGKTLVEGLKLHIFREDHIVFQLAAKLITPEEFTDFRKDFLKMDAQKFNV